MCCLDQNTVTMALRRVFYHAGFYTRILINSNIALARALSILNTLSKYAYFMLNERKSEKAAGASPQPPLGELTALPQTP